MTFPSPALAPDLTFKLRPFSRSDYPAVTALYVEHDLEFLGMTNMSEELIRSDWESHVNFDPTTSVCVAEIADGSLVGLAYTDTGHPVPVRPYAWLIASPAWHDTVMPALLDWAIERAKTVFDRVPENARVVMQGGANRNNRRTADFYASHGVTTNRGFFSMLIKFDGTPIPEPVIPEGLRFVTFDQYPKIEAWAKAIKDGFSDHRGATDTPFEFYVERFQKVIAEPKFDPTIFWLALDENNTPAGVCTSFKEGDEFPDTAYIQQLAVVPAYRRRGLALALLHTSFAEHLKRGRKGVSLGVDASSLTNAVALYERAGMSVASIWDAYELELRPGVEITKQ